MRRFIPGEELDDAVRACRALRERGAAAVLTLLGENVTEAEEAREVREHYVGVLERAAAEGLDAEISVKLTQLGLDLDPELALDHLRGLADAAPEGRRVWVDMEGSDYTDVTLELYRRCLAERPNTAICLQAYLYRTPDDLEDLLERGATIRLVKGAYAEPPDVAYPTRADVDDAFRRLAFRLLDDAADPGGRRHAVATHDMSLVSDVRDEARRRGLADDACEIQMLYGIRTRAQERLARDGASVRVLVSYGPEWFPWYMRRLAERPANVGFLLRSFLPG